MSITSDDYAKVFDRLTHLAALTKEGKTTAVVDNLVIAVMAILDDGQPMTAHQVLDGIHAYFSLSLSPNLIQSSLDRQANAAKILRVRTSPPGYRLATEARTALATRVEDATLLEQRVRREWLAAIERDLPYVPRDHQGHLWECLTAYMTKVFHRHGAETMQLLDPSLSTDDALTPTLSAYLDEAIAERCNDGVCSAIAKGAVEHFFRHSDPLRTKYLAQLLDGTFTFFALTSDKVTGVYLRTHLKPLSLFLDTSFILGLIDVHETSLAGVSKELIDFIRVNKFPFSLLCHEETVCEYERTIQAIGRRLRSHRWSSTDSSVALQSRRLTGIERRFHELNAERPIAAEAYLSKYSDLPILLREYDIDVFRPARGNDDARGEVDRLVAAYREYLARRYPHDPKVDSTIRHDVAVWASIQRLRRRGASILDAGALFLTIDTYFHRFDWQELRHGHEIGCVVLPNHFLQVLRPFVPSTQDFDRSFVQTLAVPEFRIVESGYAAVHDTVTSYTRVYADLARRAAAEMMSKELLRTMSDGLDGAPAGAAASLENALGQANEQLLEEIEALEEARAEILERASVNEHLLKELGEEHERTKAELDGLRSRVGEAESRERAVQAHARASEAKLARQLDRHEQLLARLEHEKNALTRTNRILVGTVIAALGIGGLLLMPVSRFWAASLLLVSGWGELAFLALVVRWSALVTHPSRWGLIGCAVVSWIGVTWAVWDPAQVRYWLGTLALPALLVALQILRGREADPPPGPANRSAQPPEPRHQEP